MAGSGIRLAARVPSLDDLLHAAVGGVGGTERPGQVEMAQAVADAVDAGEHLLVQAGTGTGKSLAYLVPAVAHAVGTGRSRPSSRPRPSRSRPRSSTATCPGSPMRSTPLLGRRPTYALVKGRRNYVCLHKLEGGFPDDDADTLISVGEVDAPPSRLGAEVVRLREWAEATESGDRDELVPGVSERAWRQVSVSADECLGSGARWSPSASSSAPARPPRDVDVVVTNHSFMAIDAFEGRQMLPEHDLLVVDEAHELVDRVTATITDELTPGPVRAAGQARRPAGRSAAEALEDAATLLVRRSSRLRRAG